MDINSTLVKTIDYIVSQRINDLPIDKTITGTVESKNEDGTYSILEGSLRFVALSNGQNYRSGQQVLVLIPGGDYSNDNKIILGLKSAMATSEQLMPYVRPRDKMIHVNDEGIKELIEGQVYRNIENYYRRCNCVSVSANVKTNFTHNITEGSYGLLVHILDGEKIVETLDLNNKKDMFGNTFKFVTALPQEVTYSVDLSGVSLNGLGVKYETYIGDLYYIDNNNQKVLYHPTNAEITFSNIVVSFGFDTTQKPAKELDFLLKDADTLQLLWYNMDASGKSWEFTDGEFNLDYAINYKKYQEQVNEMLILEDYSALTDEEQALFKKLYNPEKGKEAEVFDQLRKGKYKGVNPFDNIYYGIEWKITNKKESGLWKVFESDGQLQTVKPRQSKWQNTYVKAVVYRNGEIFEKVYDGVFENPIVTETSEDGHIYYTGIKLIHDQSSRPHYDCYGYTNLVTNSEDIITRKVKWSSILNEEYSIEEPPKLQPLGVYWYVPTNNTMLVPIGGKNEEKPMAGYDCYKADVFDYKIKSHFAPYDKNNTLKCRVYLDNVNYYEAELTFSFTTKGTMGTDYSLIIKEEYDRYAATAPSEELNFYNSIVRDPNGQEVEKWSEENTNGVKIEAKKPQTYPGIVEVTATFGDNKLIAYQPIALNTSGETIYYQGPTEVVYDAFGVNPRYDKTEPKLIDNKGKQIDDIYWSYSVPIPDTYSSNEDYQVIILTAKRNEVTIWQQPLFLFQDLYGNSYLNKWDGKLKVDESTGRVLASMIGAGHKDSKNKFTGVLMGDVETLTPTNDEPNKMTRETGLFGYSAGVQTFGVKTDGTVFLGNRNGGIQFNGETGKISNADESILIDFTDERKKEEENAISIEEGVEGVRVDDIITNEEKIFEEIEEETDEETNIKTRKISQIFQMNVNQNYTYERSFVASTYLRYEVGVLDARDSIEIYEKESLQPKETVSMSNRSLYEWSGDESEITKIKISSFRRSGIRTDQRIVIQQKESDTEDWSDIDNILNERSYEWTTESTHKRLFYYKDIVQKGSQLKFQNGEFSFSTDDFDMKTKNVTLNSGEFTIRSDSRKNQPNKEILQINDSSYIFRTKDFIEAKEETEITEFNLVINADIKNNNLYKEINNAATIIKFNELDKQLGVAFKTKELAGIEPMSNTITIKSSGEGANITLGAEKCSPGGYWVKAFLYQKDYLNEETGVYSGPLTTVYYYPGDKGDRLTKTTNTRIVTKKSTISKIGITGAELDLQNKTLKMGGEYGDIYIGVQNGEDLLSDDEAKGKIFIGGDKYALRIGKFKIDWNGNQVQ